MVIRQLLPPNRKEAPRKKFRGLRRYFRRVFARVDSCTQDVSDDYWYDYFEALLPGHRLRAGRH